MTPSAVAELNKRIINGTAAAISHPWMASIGLAGTQSSRTHFCGGVLVDSTTVVTAAHCVLEYENTPRDLQVTIGKLSLSSVGNGAVLPVFGIIVHPAYDIETSQNDIAIVKLSEAAPTSQFAKLATPDIYATEAAKVYGWGTVDPRSLVRPEHLQEASIPLIADARCRETMGPDYDPRTMICAGTLASQKNAGDGVDTCNGDSGGPLGVFSSEEFYLLGITSWGITCAGEKYYGVYTRISSYREWIQSNPTLPPYNVKPPVIVGMPTVGSRLHCTPGTWGGDESAPFAFRWIDKNSGDVLKQRGASYVVRQQDAGKKIYCEVDREGSFLRRFSRSRVVGPILQPLKKAKVVRLSETPRVSLAGRSCTSGGCYLLVKTENNQSAISIYARKATNVCGKVSVRCIDPGSSSHSLKGKRVSGSVYGFKLPKSLHGHFFAYVRIGERSSGIKEIARIYL